MGHGQRTVTIFRKCSLVIARQKIGISRQSDRARPPPVKKEMRLAISGKRAAKSETKKTDKPVCCRLDLAPASR
jgi:hypothetical protein